MLHTATDMHLWPHPIFPSKDILTVTRNVITVMFGVLLLTSTLYSATWTTFDYPDSNLTEVRGINTARDIVGNYVVAGGFGPIQAFLYRGEVFTAINNPGKKATQAFAINDNGDIVGIYKNGVTTRGFLQQGDTYSPIGPPGSTNSWAQGIDNAGQIVGYYSDASLRMHGFELSGGIYTTIDVLPNSNTEAFGINNNGDIVGIFTSSSGTLNGLLLSDGVFTRLKFNSVVATSATSINDQKVVTGFIQDQQGARGFEYANGKYVIFNDSSVPGPLVFPDAINNGGSIVGAYLDTNNFEHGFLRFP